MKRALSLLLVPVSICLAQHAQRAAAPGSDETERMLARVAAIHGNAGVFAVAGYRMGERALRDLGEERGSFALDVTHKTPMQVQYSCVADGWQAATGVSAGKLNLHVVETTPDQLHTTIKDRKSGKELVFRLRPAFLRKYLDLPYDRQSKAAHDVALLPDDQIFMIQTSGK